MEEASSMKEAFSMREASSMEGACAMEEASSMEGASPFTTAPAHWYEYLLRLS